MVKQKIVIKVSMVDPEKCSKALQVATKFIGVISASLEGDRIVVVSEGVDAVALTSALRKKMRSSAELINVAPVEAKKEEKKLEATKEEKKPTPDLSQFLVPPQILVDPTRYCVVYDHYPYHNHHYPYHNPDPCPIL